MYTITYNRQSGWRAIAGMLAVAVGALLPLAHSGVLGPVASTVLVTVGALVAGLSSPPGAPTDPTVIATLPSEPKPTSSADVVIPSR